MSPAFCLRLPVKKLTIRSVIFGFFAFPPVLDEAEVDSAAVTVAAVAAAAGSFLEPFDFDQGNQPDFFVALASFPVGAGTAAAGGAAAVAAVDAAGFAFDVTGD